MKQDIRTPSGSGRVGSSWILEVQRSKVDKSVRMTIPARGKVW